MLLSIYLAEQTGNFTEPSCTLTFLRLLLAICILLFVSLSFFYTFEACSQFFSNKKPSQKKNFFHLFKSSGNATSCRTARRKQGTMHVIAEPQSRFLWPTGACSIKMDVPVKMMQRSREDKAMTCVQDLV